MSCVLTLALDDASQACFERLRRAWFPAELNKISAHVTLFHTLPEGEQTADVLRVCAGERAAFAMEVGAPKLIGRGVAYFFASAEAKALHARLRDALEAELTAQDRQGFRPHVVVQNKVTGDVARATLAALQGEAVAEQVTAVGLDLWRYLGGPWELLQRFKFPA